MSIRTADCEHPEGNKQTNKRASLSLSLSPSLLARGLNFEGNEILTNKINFFPRCPCCRENKPELSCQSAESAHDNESQIRPEMMDTMATNVLLCSTPPWLNLRERNPNAKVIELHWRAL